MNTLKDAIRAAADEKDRQKNQNAGIPENQKTRKPEDQHSGSPEATANLSIKVSKRQRLHWLLEAKKQNTSLTAAIITALNARFGPPEE